MVEFTDLPDDILFLIYDHLEIFSIKKLQYYSKLTDGIRRYLYNHSRYLLYMDETQLRNEELIDMGGYKMSQLVNNESMRKHISHFKYYQIEISIFKFEDSLKILEYYQDIINCLFGKEVTKNIKLHIRLNYSLSSFNDIKDCLVNVDKISHFFNNNNNNNSIQIDLELNRR